MSEATKLSVKTEKKPPSTLMSNRYGPFDTLRREIDRVFEGFGIAQFPFNRSLADFDAFPRVEALAIAPAVDVAEHKDAYEITAELPGMDGKDIDVKLSNGILTIKGMKKEEKEEHEKNYHYSERRYGSFLRSFSIPEGVDAGKIEAAFAKGVLSITLPKSADAQKNEKTISVRAA